MKTRIATAIAVITILLPSLLPGYAEFEKEDAANAVKQWLALVDAGKYRESWKEASTYFKKKVDSDKWVKSVREAREPLGEVKSRILKISHRVSSIPGAPEGDYFIMRYRTDFTGREDAIETITVIMDVDARWRIAGYFIR